MIIIEMMAHKLQEGMERLHAAAFAYGATAFPMLTGTLVSIVGFLPVGLARSQAGEYTGSIPLSGPCSPHTPRGFRRAEAH